MIDQLQHSKSLLAILRALSLPAILLALVVEADAQEKGREGAGTRYDGCELRAPDAPGMRRLSACLKCRAGYLMKGDWCRRAGDFWSVRREPRPKREPKPIEPTR